MKNITIIGIGNIGLGLALLIEKSGINVLGVDINTNYVEKLNSKTFFSYEPLYNEYLKNSNNLKITTSLEEGINHSNIIFIMIQTPNSGGDKFYDHTFLSNLLFDINKLKVSNKKIIIGSTIMPNYINNIGAYLISDCYNTTLSYKPEFIAQGNIINDILNPDIVLIGTNDIEVPNILKELYLKIVKNNPEFCIVLPLEAEIIKISINGYITTKISFANMISDLCDNFKINKNIVLKSISNDSRIGSKYFNSGYSYGGPCFPRDTKALALLLSQNNINNDILQATTKYNEFHSNFLTKKLLEDNLNNDVVIENVCYKDNSKIPIIEESPKLIIANKLVLNNKKVFIKDTESIINEVKKTYGNTFNYITT